MKFTVSSLVFAHFRLARVLDQALHFNLTEAEASFPSPPHHPLGEEGSNKENEAQGETQIGESNAESS